MEKPRTRKRIGIDLGGTKIEGVLLEADGGVIDVEPWLSGPALERVRENVRNELGDSAGVFGAAFLPSGVA